MFYTRVNGILLIENDLPLFYSYQDHCYPPPNQLILIKGRFEHMEIVTLIVKTADYFSRLSQPSGPTFLCEKDSDQINCDFSPQEYL